MNWAHCRGKLQSSVLPVNKSFTEPEVVCKRELRKSLYDEHFKRKCSAVLISFKSQKMQILSSSGSPRNRQVSTQKEYPTSKLRHSGTHGFFVVVVLGFFCVFFLGGGLVGFFFLECPSVHNFFSGKCHFRWLRFYMKEGSGKKTI